MVLFGAPGCPRNEKEAVERWQRSLGQGLANSSPRTGHLLVEMRFYRHTATLIRFRSVCGRVHATTAEWSSCDTVWPARPKHHLSGSLKEKGADPWSRQIVRWVKCWLKVPASWCQKKPGLALVVVRHCVILKHLCKPAQLKFSFALFWGSNMESKIRPEYSLYVTWTSRALLHCLYIYTHLQVNVISQNFKKDANVGDL